MSLLKLHSALCRCLHGCCNVYCFLQCQIRPLEKLFLSVSMFYSANLSVPKSIIYVSFENYNVPRAFSILPHIRESIHRFSGYFCGRKNVLQSLIAKVKGGYLTFSLCHRILGSSSDIKFRRRLYVFPPIIACKAGTSCHQIFRLP